jgi:hypothetical protein
MVPTVAAQTITQGPTVNLLYNTSVVIMWTTDTASTSTVEYGTTPSLGSSTTNTTSDTNHRVEVTGLTPNTKYYYRAGTAGHWSNIYEFKTSPDGDEPFTFLFYGDHRPSAGTTVPAEVTQLHDLMVEEDAQFIISGGDLIQDEPYNRQSFVNFQIETDRLHHNACYWVVTGNHDYPSHKELEKFYEWPDENLQKYYSFDYGNAHFTVLNSERGFNMGDDSFTLMTEYMITKDQFEWMKADLAATNKKHRFVLTHRPIFPASWRATDSNETALNLFVQALEDYNVEAILVSHDHLYARYEVGSITQIISGGGGAPLSHDLIYDRYATEKARLTHFFTRADVNGDEVTWTTIDINGVVFDTWTTHSVIDPRPKATNITSQPRFPQPTDHILINATVTDNAPPASVVVRYRRDNVVGWTWPSNYTVAPMSLVSGNLYSVDLGTLADQQGFYYYIEVNDTAGASWVSYLHHFAIDGVAPTVSITQPLSGESVDGTTVVVAHVEDAVGITRVEFYLDDVIVQNSTVSGTSADEPWTWATTSTTDGQHTIKVIVYDVGDNTAEISITVYVNNAGLPTATPPPPWLIPVIGGVVVVMVIVIVVVIIKRRKA